MLATILDVAAPSLRELAQHAGISYHSIREYRKGRRTAPPEVLRRLAKVLRTRGGRLAKAATQLEHLAGSPNPRGTR